MVKKCILKREAGVSEECAESRASVNRFKARTYAKPRKNKTRDLEKSKVPGQIQWLGKFIETIGAP